MAINLYQTQFMLPVVQQILPRHTFLRDRYFKDGTIFPTLDVLCEYKDGEKKIAPFISPRMNGITSYRDGYKTLRYTPAMVGEKRTLTIDDLNQKGFGEDLFSNKTPAQRQAEILARDLLEMTDHIIGTEEEMAAQCILYNAIVEKVYHGEIGGSDYTEWEISYFEGDSNPAQYTPAAVWDETSKDILKDLYVMAHMLLEKGLPATDFVCAPDVAQVMVQNETIQKFLDNRRYELGRVEPRGLPTGVTYICTLNAYGVSLDVFSYAEQYQAVDGTMKSYIPDGYGFVSAPGAGEAIYGAVSQLEQETGLFATYAQKRVPKYIADAKNNVRTIQLVSKPLLKPLQMNPWISAKLL